MAQIFSLINSALMIFELLLLVQFLLQRMPEPQNALQNFIGKVSNPVQKPIQSFLPSVKGYDFSALLAAFVLVFVETYVLHLVEKHEFLNLFGALLVSAAVTVSRMISIFAVSIIIDAFFNWMPQFKQNALADMASYLADPFNNFVRRFLPKVAGIDFAPLVSVVALILIRLILISPIILIGTRM